MLFGIVLAIILITSCRVNRNKQASHKVASQTLDEAYAIVA